MNIVKKGDKKDISAKEKVQTSETNHIPPEHDKHTATGHASGRSAGADHATGRPAVAGKSTEAQAEQAVLPHSADTERENMKLMKEKLLRLQADFDNFKKRMLREKNELYRRANEELILELLPVFDHLELALTAAEEHMAHGAFVEGFSLVSEQLMSVLKKFGLTPIDVEGLKFDPGRHEAISYIPSDKFPENAVITQVRRGYMLGGKLLRAAQVVVSGGEQGTESNAERGILPRANSELRVPSSNADSAQRTTDHGQQTTEKEEE